MKICNLKILNKSNEIIRDIPFNLNGVSFVLGDVEKPKDNKKTSNSIGKTLLLKMIDYIFGANEDKSIIKKELKEYVLLAEILFEGKKYIVKRILGLSSNNIFIDNEKKTLEQYKSFFKLNRSIYNRQIVLEAKQSLISFMPNPTFDDYKSILELLNLLDILEIISDIYKHQEEYKKIGENKTQILSLLDIADNKVDDEIFFNEKEIEKLSQKIAEIKDGIEKLELNEENFSLQEQYSTLNEDIKSLRLNLFELSTEKDALEKYLNDSNASSLNADIVKQIYKKAKIELPEHVVKSIDEVDAFYKAIHEDRVGRTLSRIKEIDSAIVLIEKKLKEKEILLDKIGNILSTNEAYKNALAIMYEHNNNLQELKYKQGQLSQVKLLNKEAERTNNLLMSNFEQLSNMKDVFETTHKTYKNFVYNIVNNIYDEKPRASFEIIFKEYDKKRRPIQISMDITGDAGEGVKEVKKVIIDYLLYNFNNKLDIFVHDSSCYNGIDPRQISGLIKELMSITKSTQKQAIVSINKYQLANDEFVKEVIENASIKLSEIDKLLKFDF